MSHLVSPLRFNIGLDKYLFDLSPSSVHPGICGALVGLYHHIGSFLSPQYVGVSRILSLLS